MVSSTEFAITSRETSGLHALMAHGDAVRHRNGGEFPRRAAGFRDAAFDGLRLAGEGDVAGRCLIPQVATPTKGWSISAWPRPMA
jgi:hypothetical protein